MAKPAIKMRARFPCRNMQHREQRNARGEWVGIVHPCGYCSGCERNKLNDMMGRIGAHALVCTHVDFVTLTYDATKGVEQLAGSRVRLVEHVQRFIKVLRQRERRALVRHNNSERRKAEAEAGYEPLLVDASRSYLDYVCVPERGTSGKRQIHYHVLLMWVSHFPISERALLTGDAHVCAREARRVWDLPEVRGPIPEKLPPDAKNPEVIDFRVAKIRRKDGRVTGGNQLHGSWPHGYVNWQRVTHHVNTADGVPVLKERRELGESVMYIHKYMKKAAPGHRPEKELHFTKEDWENYKSGLTQGRIRSSSNGLGHDFARAVGRQHAGAGVTLANLGYQLVGFEQKRTPESQAKFVAKLRAKGVSEATAYAMIERRRTFVMQGAMAAACINEFVLGMTAKGNVSPGRLGEQVARQQMREATEDLRNFLQSHTAAVGRFFDKNLPEEVPPVRMFELDHKGDELDGREGRKLKLRPAWERLEERLQVGEQIREAFSLAIRQAGLARNERIKREVGLSDVKDLLTEELYRRRPKVERQRFARWYDVMQVQEELMALEKAAIEERQPFAEEAIQLIEESLVRWEREEFRLPRHTVHHSAVTSDVLLHWINTSDDWHFPDMREELVEMFCRVTDVSANCRVVVNPKGETFLQRKVFAPARMFLRLAHDFERIAGDTKVKGRSVWASRLCVSEGEISEALAGKLSLRSVMDRAAIFAGPQPFRIDRAKSPPQARRARSAKREGSGNKSWLSRRPEPKAEKAKTL